MFCRKRERERGMRVEKRGMKAQSNRANDKRSSENKK
jgi:hypothetical protein